MALAPTPKFSVKKDTVEKSRPRTEAAVMARSAEVQSRGKNRGGRPAATDPSKQITVSLPESLVKAIDDLAAAKTFNNRSLALVELLNGRLKLSI